MADREHHDGCQDIGLYAKYDVRRVDDSPRHPFCDYFVLDLSHDPEARRALEVYADLIRAERPVLASDLYVKLDRYAAEQDTGGGDG